MKSENVVNERKRTYTYTQVKKKKMENINERKIGIVIVEHACSQLNITVISFSFSLFLSFKKCLHFSFATFSMQSNFRVNLFKDLYFS